MSQSFSDIYVHIVFSTYGRVKCLSPSLAPQIWKYLAGICHVLNCPALEIGGTDDHVHILCKLSNDITVQDLVKKLKSSSSKWLKKTVLKYSTSIGKEDMEHFLFHHPTKVSLHLT